MISRETLIKNAKALEIEIEQLLEGVDDYELVSAQVLARILAENKEHRENAKKLLSAAKEQGQLSAENCEIEPHQAIARILAENQEHKANATKFMIAAQKLGSMIDFKKSPMKAVMTLQSMFTNPEKYKDELAPILSLFTPKQETNVINS